MQNSRQFFPKRTPLAGIPAVPSGKMRVRAAAVLAAIWVAFCAPAWGQAPPPAQPAGEATPAQPAMPEQPAAAPAQPAAGETTPAQPAMPEQPAMAPQGEAARAAPGEPVPNLELFKGPPTRVRVAIRDASGRNEAGTRIVVLLDQYQRRELERQIGLKLDVVNSSAVGRTPLGRSVIYYRPGFMRAALLIARAIPGNQIIEQMRPDSLHRIGVDVEIWVGKDTP